MSNSNETRSSRRHASAKEIIEHVFAIHTTIFYLFSIPRRFKLLVYEVDYRKLVLNSFFPLNCFTCFTCFNELGNNFNIWPPTIEEYIPMH